VRIWAGGGGVKLHFWLFLAVGCSILLAGRFSHAPSAALLYWKVSRVRPDTGPGERVGEKIVVPPKKAAA
jgi:hypothetical protein